MSTVTAAFGHLIEELDRVLQDATLAVKVRSAHVRAANDRAVFSPFISDSAIKAADQPSTGTKP